MITVNESKSRRIPIYQDVDGFRIPVVYSAEAFRSALSYRARDDDLFIVTYPKCGTTWVQYIVADIFRGGQPFSSPLEFRNQSPFLEQTGAAGVEKMERPGAIKCHLPFRLTPYNPKAKYIHITRNPKDCCVSYYYHTKNGKFDFADGTFDDFFEVFLEGNVAFGDYFDTLLSWFKHKDDPNVMFITFEDLKEKTTEIILSIAEFLGPKYKEELEKNESRISEIISRTSFSSLKETHQKEREELKLIPDAEISNHPDLSDTEKALLSSLKLGKRGGMSSFFRKGEIGDWRNHFSEEQSVRLDQKFQERTRGTDIHKLWIKYM